MAKHRQVWRTKARNVTLQRNGKLGGAALKESPLEEIKSSGS